MAAPQDFCERNVGLLIIYTPLPNRQMAHEFHLAALMDLHGEETETGWMSTSVPVGFNRR